MAVSESSQWAIFGIFTILGLVGIVLWFKFLPTYRAYKVKSSKLQVINSEYEELRKRRKDLVFHFYWCVDSGNMKEADQHEVAVLDIDKKLETLRASYDTVERGG